MEVVAPPPPLSADAFFEQIECDICLKEFQISDVDVEPDDIPVYWMCSKCRPPGLSESDDEPVFEPELTEYEEKRMANMKRCQEFLASLEVPQPIPVTKPKKRRWKKEREEEYVPEDESVPDDEVPEEPPRPKPRKKARGEKVVIRAPPTTEFEDVAAELVPFGVFQGLIDTRPMMRIVAELSNPANYDKLKTIITEDYNGACARPCFGPFDYKGKRVYLMNVEVAFEFTFYFQKVMPGRYLDLHMALANIGELWPGREIPAQFALGKMADAKTFVIEASILEYLWLRFRPFGVEELKVRTDRVKRQGNSSVLNLDERYVDDRPLPDFGTRKHIDAMLARGMLLDAGVGYVSVVVESLAAELQADLEANVENANLVNGIMRNPKHHQHEYMKELYPVCKTRELTVVPTDINELRMCVIYNKEGKLLSLPRMPDNDYISFGKRKRPSTPFPYATVKFP